MASHAPTFRGGCLCGALRYVAEGDPIDAAYCHCRMCQRAGAPVLAWGTFPSTSFRYEQGTATRYASSSTCTRDFCPTCGSQILFQETGSGRVDVNLGTLDEPERVPPEYHIFTESRIPWFDTRDDLPRHPDSGPDGKPD